MRRADSRRALAACTPAWRAWVVPERAMFAELPNVVPRAGDASQAAERPSTDEYRRLTTTFSEGATSAAREGWGCPHRAVLARCALPASPLFARVRARVHSGHCARNERGRPWAGAVRFSPDVQLGGERHAHSSMLRRGRPSPRAARAGDAGGTALFQRGQSVTPNRGARPRARVSSRSDAKRAIRDASESTRRCRSASRRA